MVVRSEAIIQLRKMDAISVEDLAKALSVNDEGVQIIAARGLGKKNRVGLATETLKRLANSKDKRTAIFARTTLLGSGDRTQIGYLRKVILDPKTTDTMLISLLDQIRVEKISTALPLAEALCAEDRPLRVRIRSHMVIDDLSPGAARKLLSSIRKSQDLLLTCNLLRLLSQRDDAEEMVRQLSGRKDTTGSVARFELRRAKGGKPAETALKNMLALEHPVLVEYAIDRMRTDVKEKGQQADFYVGPFMDYIKNSKIDPDRMTTINERVARIIKLFGDLSSTGSLSALKEFLGRQSNTTLRELTVGALYRCDNKGVCDLVRPMRNSPFPKISTYATLLLARHGDTAAIEQLIRLQKETLPDRVDLLTMTNWYILKFAGRTSQVMKRVAGKLR
jgi:hypothetical protein